MKRRDLLKSLALCGVAVSIPAGRPLRADPVRDDLWMVFHAAGGWDPTFVCDLKNTSPLDSLDYVGGETQWTSNPDVNRFFTDPSIARTIINGVDHLTNAHDTGFVNAWTGSGSGASFSALVGMRDLEHVAFPMVFSGPAYLGTGNLVVPTPASSVAGGSVNLFARTGFPERFAPDDSSTAIVPDRVAASLRAAQNARLARLASGTLLPSDAKRVATLHGASEKAASLRHSTTPDQLFSDTDSPEARGAIAGLVAMLQGLGTSATVGVSGFDTHHDHDVVHSQALSVLFGAVNRTIEVARQVGLLSRLNIVITSEFGRTPYYSGSGKDHWPVSSMVCAGPLFRGNRVWGETDADLRPIVTGRDGLSTTIEIGHVHQALRRIAGIPETLTSQFPIGVPDIGLFGAA